jgi:hypothetical protein
MSEIKERVYYKIATLSNERQLTVAAIQYASKIDPNETILQLGWAVRNPGDEQKEDLGKTIALGRAKKWGRSTGYFAFGTSRLSKEFVSAVMEAYVSEFDRRFDEFVPTGNHNHARRKIQPRETTVESTS